MPPPVAVTGDPGDLLPDLTGAFAQRALPAELGLHRTWQRIAERLRLDADLDEGADWTVGVDSTVVRAHKHAAGARHKQPADHPADQSKL
ncbi:hypothetical protein ACFPIJ_40555 [Dactylosporangium cerinum]|uniref:Transposase n=1 Tax=Dactylosporangium cerinum TaxID=1434730 RepID=A0ABV9W866_9ACTN